MKTKVVLVSLCATAVLTGSCHVVSLTPFYTNETSSDIELPIPREPSRWEIVQSITFPFQPTTTNKMSWTFCPVTEQHRTSFDVETLTDATSTTSTLHVVFFVVDGRTHCDVTSKGSERENNYWNATKVPAHVVGRVHRTNDLLRVELMDLDWFATALTNGTLTMQAARAGKALLVTSQDADWTGFLKKHGNTPGVFSTNMIFELRRASPDSL